MARKDTSPKPHHGFNDIIGLVLIAASVLLVVALFSFDIRDLPIDSTNVNPVAHNLIGKFGAWMAKISMGTRQAVAGFCSLPHRQ